MELRELESTPSLSDSPKKRRLVVILVMIAIVVSTITIYELSYHSVDGTHPQLVSGARGFNFCTTTFFVSVIVWSWAGSLQTQVNNPIFDLSVNGVGFGTEVGPSNSFQPYNSITYPLTFQLVDCAVANTLSGTNTYDVQLQMTADVSAGIYGGLITKSDAATWTLS